MGGGYDSMFNQYRALPTNLQNYTGGMGSPSLMNQAQGAPGNGYVQQLPQQPGPVMGGFNTNPYMAQSPYAAQMGGMPPGMGGPMQPMGEPRTGADYNAMAQQMSGVPEGGQKSNSAKKFKQLMKKLRRRLKKQAEAAPPVNTKSSSPDGGGGEGSGQGGGSGGTGGSGGPGGF